MTTANRLHIYGWAADQAGCHWYRLKLPLDAIREQYGHKTESGTRLTAMRREKVDILIGQRVCLQGSSYTWQELAHRNPEHRPLLVYEVDDDLFNLDAGSNPDGHAFYNRPGVQHNIRINVAAADLVTVSTPYLADLMREHNPNVHVIPNCIPQWLTDWDRPQGTPGMLTIGWQGSQTHAMDWEGPAGYVSQFIRRHGLAELHLMGGQPDTAPRATRVTDWTDTIDGYYRAVDWDIALAPLRPHLFNRSKSYIRVLEAAALGIPVIASNTGPYAEFVRHGITGYLLDRDHEWSRYLRLLAENPAHRWELGENARKQARSHTVELNAHRWMELYQDAYDQLRAV